MRETVTQDVVAAAVALGPEIRAVRDQMESDRRMPASLAQSMNQAGLFQLGLPRSMGGPETDPLTAFRAIEELSKIDGSVGWCALIASGSSQFVGYLKTEVGRSLFGQPPDVRIAGSIRPEGRALMVDGGYRVSGRWNYASGVTHANWLMCTCKVEDDHGPRLTPEGIPETRGLLVPVEAARIIDTWHVMGLCGTGSNDFVVEEVFIPENQAFSSDTPPEEAGPLYHPSLIFIVNLSSNAANALGMARGAMEAFVELAASIGSTMSTVPLRDRSSVQTTVAEAEAIISAARAHVLDAVATAYEVVANGKPDPGIEIAQARLAIAHSIHESVRAVDLLFHAAGTNAIHRRHPLERFFRDIHVAVQHVAASPSHMESAGQALLGLRPSGPSW